MTTTTRTPITTRMAAMIRPTMTVSKNASGNNVYANIGDVKNPTKTSSNREPSSTVNLEP